MQNSSCGYDRASHRKLRRDDLADALRATLSADGTAASAYPVATKNGNNSSLSRAYTYDAIGNPAAAYRYDPYGQLVSATGPEKDRFRHRFSTKRQDKETGLLYYGYRYLETTTGRWPSRNRIGERGGVSLHGFVGNDGVGRWDLLDLSENSCEKEGDEGNIRYAMISFGHPLLGGSYVIPGEKLAAGVAASNALKTLLDEALGKVAGVASLTRGGFSASGMTSVKISTVGIYQCCVCKSGGGAEWSFLKQESITSRGRAHGAHERSVRCGRK